MASRYIVGFKENETGKEVEKITGGRITGKIPRLNAYEVELGTGQELDLQIAHAQQNPDVEYAERNYYLKPVTALDNNAVNNPPIDWSERIQLQAAYDLIERRGIVLHPVAVAVIDSSFQTDIGELNGQYVDRTYWLNATALGTGFEIHAVDPTDEGYG